MPLTGKLRCACFLGKTFSLNLEKWAMALKSAPIKACQVVGMINISIPWTAWHAKGVKRQESDLFIDLQQGTKIVFCPVGKTLKPSRNVPSMPRKIRFTFMSFVNNFVGIQIWLNASCLLCPDPTRPWFVRVSDSTGALRLIDKSRMKSKSNTFFSIGFKWFSFGRACHQWCRTMVHNAVAGWRESWLVVRATRRPAAPHRPAVDWLETTAHGVFGI